MATLVQAVRLALHYGETHLGVTDIFGEDVGPPLGGVFTATQGLKTAWNSPLDERGIVGTAMGIAYGLMLSAIVDPNPVMVLLPKALLRIRGDELIPGEPSDADQLKQVIDAPVGDRKRWQP